jgi:ABC-type uncharacterized transport system auxiliary subunit
MRKIKICNPSPNTQQISGTSPKPFAKLALALALSSILVGCNNDSTDSDHASDGDHSGHDHEDTHIESAGRLAVLNSADKV